MKTSLPKKFLVIIMMLNLTLQSNFNAVIFHKENLKGKKKYVFYVLNPDMYNLISPDKKINFLNEDGSPDYEKMASSAQCDFPDIFEESSSEKYFINFYLMGYTSHIKQIDRGEMIKNNDDYYFIYYKPNTGNNFLSCIPFMYKDEEKDLIVIDFLLVQKNSRTLHLDVFYLETFVKDNKVSFCYYQYSRLKKLNFNFEDKTGCFNHELSDDVNYPPFLDFYVFGLNNRENFHFQSYYEDEETMKSFVKFIAAPQQKNGKSNKNIDFQVNKLNFISGVFHFENLVVDNEPDRVLLKIQSDYENENLNLNLFFKNKSINKYNSECEFEKNQLEEIQKSLKNSENTDINFSVITSNDKKKQVQFNQFSEEFPNINTKLYKKFSLIYFVSLQIFPKDFIKCKIKSNLINIENKIDDHLIINFDINIHKFLGNTVIKMKFSEKNFTVRLLKKNFENEVEDLNCEIMNLDQYFLLDKENHFLYTVIDYKQTDFDGINLNRIFGNFGGNISLKIKSRNEKYKSCKIYLIIKDSEEVDLHFKLETQLTEDYFYKLIYKRKEKTFQISDSKKKLQIDCKISQKEDNENFLTEFEVKLITNFHHQKKIINSTYWIKKNENESYLNIGFEREFIEEFSNLINNKNCFVNFENNNIIDLNIFNNDQDNVKFKIYEEIFEGQEFANKYKLEIFNNNENIYSLDIFEFNDINNILEIDLFFKLNEFDDDFYKSNFMKVDKDFYVCNIIQETDYLQKNDYDLINSKIKNYFQYNDFFHSFLSFEKIQKLSFFKGYKNYNQKEDNLYIIENIITSEKTHYFLTSVKQNLINSEYLNSISNTEKNFRKLYLYSPSIEKSQFENISKEPEEIKISTFLYPKINKSPKIEINSKNVIQNGDYEITITSIYPKLTNKNRILFICFYCEGSKIKLDVLDTNTKNNFFLNYQNYTNSIYIFRQKKNMFSESDLEFTINIDVKYICGFERKITLKRDLEDIQCFYLTLTDLGVNNNIFGKEIKVDKIKKIIQVNLYEKKRLII